MIDEMEKASRYGVRADTDEQSHQLTSHQIYKPPDLQATNLQKVLLTKNGLIFRPSARKTEKGKSESTALSSLRITFLLSFQLNVGASLRLARSLRNTLEYWNLSKKR